MTILKRAVRLGFAGSHIPVLVIEELAERVGLDPKRLPPVTMYDAAEAGLKRLVGRAVGDSELVEEGDAQRRAVWHRINAGRLDEKAQQVKDEADADLQRRLNRAAASEQQVQERGAERKQEIARETEKAKQDVRRQSQQREAAIERTAQTRRKAIKAEERKAEHDRLAAEEDALRHEQEALESDKVVTAIDRQLDGNSGGNV
jgi:hypothetical protein